MLNLIYVYRYIIFKFKKVLENWKFQIYKIFSMKRKQKLKKFMFQMNYFELLGILGGVRYQGILMRT
jgi:hypothetical protein